MDRFTLIRRLGEGATKEVFLAKDEILQREVALCKFKPHVLSGGYLKRIRREARTLAGLSHPHIVSLFDLLEDNGCFLVTEFVAGGSLKSKIASDWKNQPDLDETLRIAAEVSDALAETHARGIFHRDVKPSNVLLTETGAAKLGDYGLARPHREESTSEDGLIVGTVPYMSPEQAKGLHPDSPNDMYSFGVMLYEMVAGRRPFDGEDASVLVHHLNSTPPPPSRYVPGCPARLEKLILKLLDKDPEARPTASIVTDELRHIREEQSAGSTPVKPDEPATALKVSTSPESEKHFPRRLVAIVHADVAGYSRLSGRDEDATHQKLREYLDLITSAIQHRRGHVLNYAGDAVLAMFDAVVDAVSCAVEFQTKINALNETEKVGHRVEFRVGVNLGDVIEDRGDIFGDDVNIAARLEGLADPGGILISGAVFDAIGKKLPFGCEFMGEKRVKNIDTLVRVYKLRFDHESEVPSSWPEPETGNQSTRRIAIRGAMILFASAAAGLLAFWLSRDSPVPIRDACAIDKRMTYEVVDGPATQDSVLSLLRAANPEFIAHLDGINRTYMDGAEHRGITYSWGAPGLGKSDIARDLVERFPGASCLIKLSTLFGHGSSKLSFAVLAKPDLATVDESVTFNTLPAVADSTEYNLDSLIDASGCRLNEATVPLIIVDDIDEVHSETSSLILESLDNFILELNPTTQRFVHIVVFGRSEGLAPWFQNQKRLGAVISPFLSVFHMTGPEYRVTGDLEVLANDRFEFILGMDTWRRMKQGGAADGLIQEYIDYVRRHRFLSYSIRALSVSRMITERARVNPSDTVLELKSFLFDQLLLRAAATHGRPEPGDDHYLRILEAVAAKYASDDKFDNEGFFSVGVNDTVPLARDDEPAGAVTVRAVLDHSGIAITKPATHATARYRFEPAWVLAYLVELHNQRSVLWHQARSCY